MSSSSPPPFFCLFCFLKQHLLLPWLCGGQKTPPLYIYLIKKELPALLLSQVHHFHCHLTPWMLLSSNADDTCGPFANLYIVLQHCPGIPLVHYHPKGSFELLMSHNHWVLTGQLPFHRRVLGKVKVAGTRLSLTVSWRPCWWWPALGHCDRLLHCWGFLGSSSFRNHPGEVRRRLIWWKRLGFGCGAVGWTPLLGSEESIRLWEEQIWKQKKEKMLVRLSSRHQLHLMPRWPNAFCSRQSALG